MGSGSVRPAAAPGGGRSAAPAPLSGRTALVTGACRGPGRAIAPHLTRAGAAVGVNCRARTDAAESVVMEVRAGGGRAVVERADAGDPVPAQARVARVESELGGTDILVNNAGVFRPA